MSTADYFAQSRARDAEGGVVRSYAHTWCYGSAVSTAIEILTREPWSSVTLVVADHDRKGDRVHAVYKLVREDEAIRANDAQVTTLRYGIAQAAAELAHMIASVAHEHDALIFRQP